MKNFLTITILLIAVQIAFGQRDTVVYYKNRVPQLSFKNADSQVIVKQKNQKVSMMTWCSFEDGKWKVDKTETIRLKKNNTYQVSNGLKHYQRKFKKIPGGYQVEDYNHAGQLHTKGISKSLFPLHCHGQWLTYTDGIVTGIDTYKNGVIQKSYITDGKKNLFPTNTFANADVLAEYESGIDNFERDLVSNITYPVICQENGITGRVLILFGISENGSPCDIHIFKGADHYLNQAAAEAVKKCKHWKPAMKNGKPIKVYTIVPINFDLR